MDLLWTHLLTAPPLAAPLDGIAAWRARHEEAGAALRTPFERAVAGGFAADRLGYAFLSGYQEALRQLVPGLGGAPAALCATEEGGAHPRAIRTTLRPDGEGWILDGEKRWITLGTQAEVLLVVASTGLDEDGRNRLALLRVPADRQGVHREPAPPTPFIPEIEHARLHLRGVTVGPAEWLPGDGYETYLKPFRTIEDLHVHGALLGWLLQVARRAPWPRQIQEEILCLLLGLQGLDALPALAPATHIALGGALSAAARLLREVEPLWQGLDEAERARWERDRPLLQVAGAARAQRLTAAWQAVITGAGAAAPAPRQQVLPTMISCSARRGPRVTGAGRCSS
jgi:hypothetical protein